MKRILLGLLMLPIAAVAHPGPSDVYGCHHCWEDCEKWGLRYGELHCHKPQPGEDQDSLSDPHKHYQPRHSNHSHDYPEKPQVGEEHDYEQKRDKAHEGKPAREYPGYQLKQ